MERQLKEGKGWRLGWQPNAAFPALLGTNQWAVELTAAEFADFRRLLLQLVDSVAQLQDQLMAEETITCEASSDLLWLEVRGYPQQFDLSFILLSGRRAEGQWPAESAAELVGALQTIEVF
ncbi:DUF1818 family protein [Acaryochloris sp. IP29b_bin.148]|uniref:DUF1818 family protein n=1 Tax=Acaryochloris sp. IP29b_bin.148 TaxID=2969218 RepID=UPI0026055C26|nr:DUF1818 family protein [Acaryochloris sp. IP29b_bin.148]